MVEVNARQRNPQLFWRHEPGSTFDCYKSLSNLLIIFVLMYKGAFIDHFQDTKKNVYNEFKRWREMYTQKLHVKKLR